MSPARLQGLLLPERWFERPQYAPRVSEEGVERWYPRSGSAARLRDLPAGPPEARRGEDLALSRSALRAAFDATYDDWGIDRSPEVEAGLASLATEDVSFVVTGQQPGFLTGPLYTIYKAVSAIAVGRAAARAWGRPVLPVFWVAGEDHDIEEAREARLPGRDDGEVIFRLPHAAERRPLSSLPVDDRTVAVLDEVERHLAGRRYAKDTSALLALYRGRTVASGFAAVLSSLFGRHGLLVIDPGKLSRAAVPLVRRIIEDPPGAVERVREGARLLEERGLAPTVAPRLPLFLVRDGRRDHLAWRDGSLVIDGGGPRLERRELLEALARRPESFSSGALLRPLVQEVAFPGALTIGGPAEVSYFAELPPLARWLGLSPPRIALRLQATLLEARAARAWRKLELSPERLAAASGPEDLVRLDRASGLLEEAAALEARSRALLERSGEETRLAEPSRRRVERAARKAVSAAESLRGRVDLELRRSREESFTAARSLWDHVLPGGVLQERRWNVFHYLSRYGTEWLDELLEEARGSPLEDRHRLVFFDGAEGGEGEGEGQEEASPGAELEAIHAVKRRRGQAREEEERS